MARSDLSLVWFDLRQQSVILLVDILQQFILNLILRSNTLGYAHILRSARASCTTSGQPALTPARAKNLDTYLQAYMPHESSGDSSNQPRTV